MSNNFFLFTITFEKVLGTEYLRKFNFFLKSFKQFSSSEKQSELESELGQELQYFFLNN